LNQSHKTKKALRVSKLLAKSLEKDISGKKGSFYPDRIYLKEEEKMF